jgi:PAS domain S-box-containing protein
MRFGPTRALSVSIALSIALSSTPARAQVQRLGGTDYVSRVWTTEHGLPTNSVTSILQTPDGFLWVGTFGGLARFDGTRFEVFNARNTPALKSDRIVGLFGDGRGGFWVISEQSDVARYDGTAFTAFNRATGAPVDRARAAFLDDDGGYWLAGEGLIHHVRDGRIVRRYDAREGVPNGVINQIVKDDRGAYLFAADSGLLVIRSAGSSPERVGDDLTGGRVMRFASRRAGGWWVVAERGITVWEHGALRGIGTSPAPGVRGSGAAEAPDGTLWIATANFGIEQWKRGSTARLPLAAAPGVDAYTRAIFVDREENVWFAPNGGGLVRLSPARVTSLGKPDGMWRDDVWSVVQDREGAMWISAWKLHRLRNGRLDTIPGFSSVTALHPDADGSVWVGHEDGVSRLKGTEREDYAIDPPMRANAIRSIFRDRSGRVFAGRNGGVLELKDRRMVDAFDGALRAARGVSVITQDRSGALYFGGADGLRVLDDGRWTHYTTASGLGHDQVRNVHEDAGGALWIATYGGGLARLAGGRFARIGTDQGLAEDVVSRILDDGGGNFWLSGNRGISRVSQAELNAVADGRLARVAPVLFTVADGMPTNETEGWISWAGWRATDGRLWFPTVKGLAVIDPSRRHALAPPVAVTDVFADGTRLTDGEAPRALPGEGNLEIRYTALSFIAPEKVRFRYRLDGFEDRWTDPGDRRTAYYTKVPPGRYTFRVVAANDDGVWNDTGATLAFTLEPHFYQRTEVRALAILLLVAIASLGVRWRLRLLHDRVRREQAVTERLRQVDKLKDEFLANTSHELRTPLNGIIGLAESLLGGVAGRLDQRVTGDLSLIASSGHRLSRLVNDILDLSRLRHQDLALRRSAVDVGSAATVVLTLARPLAAGKPVALACAIEPGLSRVWADEDRLQQILLNLVENAIKFTAQGSVTVSASVAGDSVEIVIADTGIGVPREHQERIFEPFTQADASTTRRFGGTGLGLSVTRQLVELHGGTIRVDSEAGAGARFAFTLPVAASSNGVGHDHEPHIAVPALAGVTVADVDVVPEVGGALPSPNGSSPGNGYVLVVDDDAVNARVLGSFLALGHYRTEVVSSGPDAVAAALRATDPPDLVLLDVMMPEMDGFAVCERIRAHRGIDELPIILVTAKTAVAALVAGLEAGANDFLAKPVARDELLTRVRTHLSLREANRQLRGARDSLEDQVRDRTTALQAANQRLGQLNRELEEVNQDLGAANAGMRSILDQLRTGVIATDTGGQVTFASRTAELILDCTAEEAVGRRWQSLITVDAVDRAALKALVAAPPDNGEPLATRLHSTSGRRYWVQIEVQEDPRAAGGRIIFLSDVSDLYDLPLASRGRPSFHGLVGDSPHMQMIAKEIGDIARTDTTVLIEGETGTGKELVARAIHASSGRAGGSFIALNCAGLAESILAGQLFGHKRGAFTGAVADQVGLIEAASGGTLFLDEIGDIPLSVQATLLRTLQEREVVRLGETRVRKIDVRIVAATHRDLPKRVLEGAFRDDFLYRIRVARINVPPLRDRIGDLPLLVSTFLREIAASSARQLEISSEAMEFLNEHAWPGNVRELRAALEHAALKCRGGVVRPGDLPPEILAPSPWTAERAVPAAPDARQRLIDALAKTGGNRSAAARLLGISRPTLYARLKALGLIDS